MNINDIIKRFGEGDLSLAEMRENLKKAVEKTEVRYSDYAKKSTAKTDSEAVDETLKAAELGTFLQKSILAAKGNYKAQEFISNAQTKTTLIEGTDTLGGTLVPTELEEQLFAFQRGNSVVMPYATILKQRSDFKKIPVLDDSISVEWHDEGDSIVESNPTFAQAELTPQRLDCYTKISNELLQDSALEMVSILVSQFAESAAMAVDSAIFNSDGSAGGGFSGVFTAAAGYSTIMASGSGAFSSVMVSNLLELYRKVPSYARKEGKFYCHPDIVGFLATEQDSEGQYRIPPYASDELKIHGKYPIIESTEAPSTSGAGKAFVSFCNPKWLAIGRRSGLESLIDPYSDSTSYSTNIVMVQRLAFAYLKNSAFARLLTYS